MYGLTTRFPNTPTGTLVNRTEKHQSHAATCGLEIPVGLVVIGMIFAAYIAALPVVLSARGCPRLHPTSKPKVELAFYKTKELNFKTILLTIKCVYVKSA